MSDFDRRAFLGTLAAAGAAMPLAASASESLKLADIKKEADVACIYHVDFGDPKRYAQVLNNISNHYSVYGSDPFALQLAIVAHSGGIKFFLDNLAGTHWEKETLDPELVTKLDALSKNGLKVYLCSITFERNKLSHDRARQEPYIAFVPSGVATVAALQTKGFAYLKVW